MAVLDSTSSIAGPWDKRQDTDYRVEWFSGSGKGGQHRNKHQNSCRLIHIPTGIVEARQGRNRIDNFNSAKKAIEQKLTELKNTSVGNAVGSIRKDMVGSGQRGDKIRTIRSQDNTAVDHKSGKRMPAGAYLNGHMDQLW